ncbi:MAG: SPOR domain-containing protein [Bacteroidetes bacterium]|nr:SPOR domain-containing protein [Bacteroidota bacterium]
MKWKRFYIFFFLTFLAVLGIAKPSIAQETANPSKPYYPYPLPFPNTGYPLKIDSSSFFHPRLMQPIIGFGPSILTFYGDVSNKSSLAPSLSNLGYHLTVSEYIKPYLLFSARAMFGKLRANEQDPRYANFQSSIRSGGLNVSYNFDNFLPKKRMIDPFILTGFEYFEYLSKTDMFDASGNKYYYWNDGSIKNMAENAPNASLNAVSLTRDYTYETDIRKMNQELFGKYPERSFALPVGVGFTMHLHPRWDFKLGTTMHFSFTDYIDGIRVANKGTGKGNSRNDKYLETYFTLSFHLFNPKAKSESESSLSDAELLALENEDTDGDGVTDFKDSCQGTPPGISVNSGGCPPDSDGDGIPDYADKEINSPSGAFIDVNGIAIDDSAFAQNWRKWSDSTNQYVTYNTVTNSPVITGEGWSKKRNTTIVYSDRGFERGLVVLLGIYKEGIPPAEMGKLLNVHDIKSSLQPDSTTEYTAGFFNKAADAEKRKDELIAAGFQNAKVMLRNKNGSLSEASSNVLAGFNGQTMNGISAMGGEQGIVYRVQLGAYSRKLSSSVFKNAGEVIVLKTDDGLYKYITNGFSSLQDAIKEREDLVKKGYKNAFVVAYKNNERIALSAASGGLVQPKNENTEEQRTPKSAIDKNLISFRIQVGSFVNEPPDDILQKINKIPGLDKKKKSNGVKYFAGKFNDLAAAQKFKEEIVSKYGIPDAFLVAFFKEELIPVQEAVELLK